MTARSAMVRLAYPITMLVLVVGILVVGGFLVTVALPDLTRSASGGGAPVGIPSIATPRPTATPAASSAMGLSPIGIAMPSDADCAACHTTTSGTVGVKNIPYLGHPLKGFANCTACHNEEGLVKTAPGHSGIHANECLVCHKENPNLASMSAPPMRPEHMSGQACTTCHGVDQHAPLPSDMVGRGNNCWICHNGPEFQYLFESPSPGWSAIPRPSDAASGQPLYLPSLAAPSASPAPSPSPSPLPSAP
jgi:hypothetical protein